jgi:hypothetical protein
MAEWNYKKTYTVKGLNFKQMPSPVSGGDSGTSTSFATQPQPYNGIDTAVPYRGKEAKTIIYRKP